MSDGTPDAPDLDPVRAGRRRLRHALVEVEQALAHPGVRGEEAWYERVTRALDRFASALSDHVASNEDTDGLFADVLDRAPRLVSRIERLRVEHDEMASRAERLRERCRARDEVEDIRRDALDLLRVSVRHRQRGADLLYEAYEQDIAAGD